MQSKELRNKIVGLLYIIFLSMVYFYIPDDFIDSTKHANRNFVNANELIDGLNQERLASYNEQLSESEFNVDSLLVVFDQINREEKRIAGYIDSLKKAQIAVRGYEKGEIKDPQMESSVYKIMIDDGEAERLYNRILVFQNLLKAKSPGNIEQQIQPLFSVDDKPLQAKGNKRRFKEVYFQRVPLAVSILNLTNFQSALEQSKSIAFENIMEAFKSEQELELVVKDSLEKVRLDSLWEALLEMERTLSEIDTSIKVEEQPLERYLSFELPKYTLVEVNSSIKYTVSEQAKLPVLLNITRNGEPLEKREISEAGTQAYQFREPGIFTLQYRSRSDIFFKEFLVVDEISTLLKQSKNRYAYPGMIIPLGIPDNPYINDNYEWDLVNCQLFTKDGFYYARFFKPGFSKVLLRNNVSERVILESDLLVQKPRLVLNLGKVDEEGAVFAEELSSSQRLGIDNNAFFNQERFTLNSFELVVVDADGNRYTVFNEGSTFSELTRQVVEDLQPGDLVIFDNMIATSPRGNAIELDSRIIRLK